MPTKHLASGIAHNRYLENLSYDDEGGHDDDKILMIKYKHTWGRYGTVS